MTALPPGRIEAIGPGDGEWLALLHAACFPAEPWPADAWDGLLAQPGVAGAALVAGDRPIGLALWRSVVDEAEILTIGVDPAHRRRAAGRMLLDHLLAVLPDGVDRVHLEVAEDNGAAVALYAAAGFRQVGIRPGYYRRPRGPAVTALLFTRVRANGLVGIADSDYRPGYHGRATRKRV